MKRLTSCFLLLGLAVAMLPPSAATAAPTIETQAEEAFLIDAETGAVLLDKNADQPMPPSSMSKLMTAYIVFDRLQEQRLSLEDKFTVSEKAWRSEEHTSELQSLMRISYAVFCLKKKIQKHQNYTNNNSISNKV